MKTARELLEQADALMRRNRKRGRDKHGGPPTLTDALGIDRDGTLAPTILLTDVDPPQADPIALETLSDLPVLTDVVDVWSRPAPMTSPQDELGLPAPSLDDALEADALAMRPDALDGGVEADSTPIRAAGRGQALIAATPAEPAVSAADAPEADASPEMPVVAGSGAVPAHVRAAVAVHEDATAREASAPLLAEPAVIVDPANALQEPPASTPLPDEEFILELPPASETDRPAAPHAPVPPVAAAAPPPGLLPGSPEWEALAEEIRMQVLQRLDLFTDTGMRDQLGARLRPIVDRAGAELVETINHELGELVRGYVAEAIEREIESWRKRSG